MTRPPPAELRRELTDDEIREQAEQLQAYLAKPGNAGVSFWLDSKRFTPADRAAVLAAWAGLDEDEATPEGAA